MEAPPGFEPGMEVLQISVDFLSCWFVSLSGLWYSLVLGDVWALMARSLARSSQLFLTADARCSSEVRPRLILTWTIRATTTTGHCGAKT
jgi:hypothetical protein